MKIFGHNTTVIASPSDAEKLRAELGLGAANVIASPFATDGTVLVYRQPEPMALEMPFKMTFDLPTKIEFTAGRSFGGLDFMRPGVGLVITERRCPKAPGVDAMLADGWRWLGWDRFAKHNGAPSRRFESEKYSSFISERRVLSGRYAKRLPTNRRRKRDEAKARRRARRSLGAS